MRYTEPHPKQDTCWDLPTARSLVQALQKAIAEHHGASEAENGFRVMGYLNLALLEALQVSTVADADNEERERRVAAALRRLETVLRAHYLKRF